MPDRVVRAGILSSEKVCSLSWPAEVFYRRLMSVADDFGRYDGRLTILRTSLYPLQIDKVSDSDVGKWRLETVKAGLVRVYAVDGKEYVEILNFGQRLRAEKSKWPSPADNCQQPPAGDDRRCQMQPYSESESNTESVDAAPKRASKQGTRLPEDWVLPDDWAEEAIAIRRDGGLTAINVALEAGKFRDHWCSKSGKDATKLDWRGTWRNWVRNSYGVKGGQAPSDFDDWARRNGHASN